MDAGELLRAGKLADALKQLETEIRGNSTDAKRRIFLFQLLCVMGNYERAVNQLKVASDLDASSLMMAQVCGPALAAENYRAEIFAGNRTPLVLGEPEEWVGWLIQANKHFADGDFAAATDLRQKAFDAAPATSGSINGHAFEWLADADQRFGPVLEAIIDGKYYWVPFSRIREITVEAPSDLRDLVWLPAILMLSAGAQKVALLPVRYPGTEKGSSDAAKLARVTDWEDKGGISIGTGQRLLATDSTEIGILEIRKIILNCPAPTAPPTAPATAETPAPKAAED